MNDTSAPPAQRGAAADPRVTMDALVRGYDWASTPLGPAERWPHSLRTAVQILLTSRFAMWMGWGPELTFLYNDAYGKMTLGVKHPWALGKPAREVWAEIWGDIGPRIRAVMETGVATWDEALLLFLERSGYAEETYHTFSYSPLEDDEGRVAGMLCVVSEETERVIGERRLANLRELAAGLSGAGSEAEVLRAVEQELGGNPKDLPFTLTYLVDEGSREARLATCTGIGRGSPAAPAVIGVEDGDAPWPVAPVLDHAATVLAEIPPALAGEIPGGAWDRPPARVAVVPISRHGQERPAGFLVAGINPYRRWDAAYAGFVGLVAGQIAGSLGSARAQEEERRRAEALAELDRAKTAFFSNVSHEFRTPLTLLLSPLEDLLRSPALGDGERDALELAHRNALRLLKLVNTLLDFSRIEAGRVDALFEPTDLGTYTAELASTFRSACERAGLYLRVDTEPMGEPVYIDREMWEKVVLNLVSNAFKHTFEGGITVRVGRVDGQAQVSVADTGVGIPAAQLPRVFERFHRVPNARSRTHEGTGIGLALAQELVRRHGGEVSVESAEGEGTIFTIRIPLGHRHLPADRVSDGGAVRALGSTAVGAAAYAHEVARWLPGNGAADPVVEGSTPVTLDPLTQAAGTASRVLLADDNADVREYVARLLRQQGWTVEAVADGTAALAAARARRPDLVLSDVMMPGLDGFALLRALRDDPSTRTVPIILLSARAGEEARVEGAQRGADDYLAKPFSAQELVARVGAHLALARERDRAAAASAAARDLLIRVLDQAPAAICVLRGPTLVYELANTSYRRMVVGGRELIGRPITEVIPEIADSGYAALLKAVYDTGEPYVGRALPLLYDRWGDGKPVDAWFNVVYHPFTEPDGNVTGVIIVATDVTDEVLARREAEAARFEAERAKAASEAANQAKSEFLAVMSHELRTPLNAISGHVELLEMGIHGPVTSAQAEALRRVGRNQRHLLGLINDVLNLARIETGKIEYEIAEVDLREIVHGLDPMIEPQLNARQLAYEVILPDALPRVRTDREKLGQVLLNLLSNAVKFTPAGGRVTLEASIPAAPGEVRVEVRDNGVGIPQEKLQAIFEPFVQVRSDLTRTTEGAGLGLAISRDLSRGMGAELTAESTPGEGSVFTLTLPVASAN